MTLIADTSVQAGWLTNVLLHFARGGAEWVLWLLVFLSVASIAVFLERLRFLSLHRRDTLALRARVMDAFDSGGLDALTADLAQEAAMEGRVLANGLRERERGPAAVEELCRGAIAVEKLRYERGLSFLASVGSNAPYVGLFGTVMGVIMAFDQLRGLDAGAGGAAGSAGVMGAIAEALIATGVGLLVAIPAIVFFNFLKSKVTACVASTELVMRTMVAYLHQRSSATEGE